MANQKSSLKKTIFLFIYPLVIGICLISFVAGFFQQKTYLTEEFLARGKALAKNLAYNSRIPLKTQNFKPLYDQVDIIMKENDIRWVGIMDAKGDIVINNGAGQVTLENIIGGKDEKKDSKIKSYSLPGGETVLDIQVESRINKEGSVAVDAILGFEQEKTPAHGGEEEIVLGTIHLGMSNRGLKATEAKIQMQFLIIFILALGLSTLVGLYFSRTFLEPVNQLVAVMEDIASSKGDLTRRIDLNRSDEFGRLANAFNHFIENIRQIVIHTGSLIGQLNTSMEQISATAEELSASADNINSNVQSFTSDLQKQKQETSMATTTINDVVKTLLEVTRKSGNATEMYEETKDVSHKGRTMVQDSVSKINSIADNMTLIESRMQELTDSLNQIGGFVESIQGIASQTNLLSLNAAIEAARAGDAGRGFSVVAEEVRKLAENASTSSEQIQNLILRIQERTSSTGDATRQGTNSVKEGRDTVHQAGDALEEILAKTTEAATISVDVANNLKEQSDMLKSTTDRVRKIEELGGNNFSNAQNIAASVEEQTASLEEITMAIQRMSQDALKVKEMIVEFKVS